MGTYLLGIDSFFLSTILGVVLGWFPVKIRIWYWRRRHPVLTPEQYLEIKRDTAHLN